MKTFNGRVLSQSACQFRVFSRWGHKRNQTSNICTSCLNPEIKCAAHGSILWASCLLYIYIKSFEIKDNKIQMRKTCHGAISEAVWYLIWSTLWFFITLLKYTNESTSPASELMLKLKECCFFSEEDSQLRSPTAIRSVRCDPEIWNHGSETKRRAGQ